MIFLIWLVGTVATQAFWYLEANRVKSDDVWYPFKTGEQFFWGGLVGWPFFLPLYIVGNWSGFRGPKP